MNKVEKIKAEIERLKESLPWGSCASQISMECNCKNEAYNEVLSYIDSISDTEKDFGIKNSDLEEACDEYYDETWDEHGGKAMVVDGCHDIWFPSQATDDFFKAGALWQKKQMMKNSAFINEAEWEDDIHKLFRERGKKVKLMIVEEE